MTEVAAPSGETGPAASTAVLRRTIGATVVVAFGVVWLRSLRFVFVEGDDAASIAFHLGGRDTAIAPSYNSYHAGADLLLAALPAKETVLRVAAIGGSALATVLGVLLVFELVRQWLAETELADALASTHPVALVGGTLLVLGAVPELFFFSLVYLPAMVGWPCVLAAHLLMRSATRPDASTERQVWLSLVAAFLTGVGVAVRWDLALVCALGLVDVVLTWRWREHATPPAATARALSVWIVGALGVFASVTALSPGFAGIGNGLNVGAGTEDRSFDIVASIGNSSAVLTPAALLLGGAGLVALESPRRWFVAAGWLVVAGLVVAMGWTVPKVFLFAVPLLVVSIAATLCRSCTLTRPGVVGAIGVVVAFPWLVGVHVVPDDATAWGPGFELARFDRPAESRSLDPVLGSGVALPTPEGPRPLWGYGAVLLGGGWADLAESRADERASAVDLAIEQDLPIIQLQGDIGYVFDLVVAQGRRAEPFDATGEVELHRFVDDETGAATELAKTGPWADFFDDADQLAALGDLAGRGRAVVFGYPSTLRTLYERAPESIVSGGAESALVDIEALRTVVGTDS